jgi:hypothetical protein
MPSEKYFDIGGVIYEGKIQKCDKYNCTHGIEEDHWIFTSMDRDLIIEFLQVTVQENKDTYFETNLSILDKDDVKFYSYPEFLITTLSLDCGSYRRTKDNSNIKSAK